VAEFFEIAMIKEVESVRQSAEHAPRGLISALGSFAKLAHVRNRLKGAVSKYSQSKAAGRSAADRLVYFKQVLQAAQKTIRSWGGAFYVVYLPARDRYAAGQEYERSSVLPLFEELGLPLIDIHPLFAGQKDPLSMFPFRRFGHYNEAGHRLVAEAVLKAITFPGAGASAGSMPAAR
jgi:hypothetical protein